MDTVAPKLDTALEQIHSVTPKIPLSLEQMRVRALRRPTHCATTILSYSAA